MWTTQETAVTTLPRERVWEAVRDLHTGALTYDGADRFELHGAFAVGTELTVTPVGQEPIRSRIDVLEPAHTYADVTDFGDVRLTFRYDLEDESAGEPAGTRVRYSLTIDGAGADAVGPELGPQISADFPESLAALVAEAERRAGQSTLDA